MSGWIKRIPFQVDIAGIIELMGTSLYSRADTPIRELIQNAHDSIMRRRQGDLDYQGRIDILQDPAAGTLQFIDDGMGLTAAEAEKYLGTLGIGITGLLKRGQPPSASRGADGGALIGQFGIGLFSAFMVAERVLVKSRHADGSEAIRWVAGPGTEIELSACQRSTPGSTVTLQLKPECRHLAEQVEALESAVSEYADFLPIPIFINRATTRTNIVNVAWFDPTPDHESVELALESYFHETPLDVIPLNIQRPVTVIGALYVTPQRVPGFSDLATVAVTVRRMVISRKVQGLLPGWASFIRGVVELTECSPTASREDLVRDETFELVRARLDELLLDYLERLAREAPDRLQALITWHRYTFAGAALEHPRLRGFLRETYPFLTSQGPLNFAEILERSEADALFETQADRVLWYNADRRQEPWISELFASHRVPCVHTLRSFEESLLATLARDAADAGETVDLRAATPSSDRFATGLLGVRDMDEAPPAWQSFLARDGTKLFVASYDPAQPVMAFLNERQELARTMAQLKQQGSIPAGFQRMIDNHLQDDSDLANEVILNRNHQLVGRALSQATGSALASVLRLLVTGALHSAGMTVDRDGHQQQEDDLAWIAESLWGTDHDGRTP